MTNPKKWTEIYPYGTKEGDDEAKFFRALGRHKKYDYRSISALVKKTGLSRERVEDIIDKYANKIQPPLVYPHPTNEDHWAYWERCPEQVEKDERNLSKKDQDDRVDSHLSKSEIKVNIHQLTGGRSEIEKLKDYLSKSVMEAATEKVNKNLEDYLAFISYPQVINVDDSPKS